MCRIFTVIPLMVVFMLQIVFIFPTVNTVDLEIKATFADDKTFVDIFCVIPAFSVLASWRKNGSAALTNCAFGGFCTVVTNGNYTFSSNSSGINLLIKPYSVNEEGVVWICEHSSDSGVYKVTKPLSSSTQDSSCHCGIGCWICNICDKFIFALLFFLFDLWRFGLRDIFGRKYKKCFRVQKLEVTRNSKPSKIACVKRFIDEREITDNWQYSKEHGYAFCNDIFENTGHSVWNVTLDNQHNLTFDFNLEGCENDNNVVECIGFEKKIELTAGTVNKEISIQWSHARNIEQCSPPANNIYNPENVLLFHSETDEKYMPLINVITFVSLYIPDMKKKIKLRIGRFLMIFFIILVLAVIITVVLRCYQVKGFCCKGWVIPVAALVSLLAIPFYGLLLFVALKIRHEWWIVEKSWKDFPDEKTSLVRLILVLFGIRGCNVSPDSSYIGNSLLDKKRYNEPVPPVTVVETTNNSIPLGKGGRLEPDANQQVENPDSLVTTSVKKKTKNKKKKKVAQDINESSEDKI